MRSSEKIVLLFAASVALLPSKALAQDDGLWSRLFGDAGEQADYPPRILLAFGGKTLPAVLDGTGTRADGSHPFVSGGGAGLGLDNGSLGLGIGGSIFSWPGGGDLFHAQVHARYRFFRRSWLCFDIPVNLGVMSLQDGPRTSFGNFLDESASFFPYVSGPYGQVGFGTELLPESLVGLRFVTLLHYADWGSVEKGDYVWGVNEEGEEVRSVQTHGLWPGALASSFGVSLALEIRLRIEPQD